MMHYTDFPVSSSIAFAIFEFIFIKGGRGDFGYFSYSN